MAPKLPPYKKGYRQRSEWIQQSEFRRLDVFPHGCPICHGEVRGNAHYLFFCPNCSMLFPKNVVEMEESGHSEIEKS